jgi:hypothetical protein
LFDGFDESGVPYYQRDRKRSEPMSFTRRRVQGSGFRVQGLGFRV